MEKMHVTQKEIMDGVLGAVETTNFTLAAIQKGLIWAVKGNSEESLAMRAEYLSLADETINECNAILKHIGGIPVIVGLGSPEEKPAKIEGFLQHDDGNWFFLCRIGEEVPFQGTATIDRLREIYSARLAVDPLPE
jgi:hypothetical protein